MPSHHIDREAAHVSRYTDDLKTFACRAVVTSLAIACAVGLTATGYAAADAAERWLRGGIEEAMNVFNGVDLAEPLE